MYLETAQLDKMGLLAKVFYIKTDKNKLANKEFQKSKSQHLWRKYDL